MTTEDDFHRALDTNPGDWQTRLVFADWLQERNDPRAEGYRALGRLAVFPSHYDEAGKMKWFWGREANPNYQRSQGTALMCQLPDDWMALVPSPWSYNNDTEWWRYADSRRAADDAAALAFAQLPAARRAELLVSGRTP